MKKAPKKEVELTTEVKGTWLEDAPAAVVPPPAVPVDTRSKAPDPVPYVAPYKSDIVTKEAFWRAVSELGHDLYQHPKEHAYADKYVATLAEKLGFQP